MVAMRINPLDVKASHELQAVPPANRQTQRSPKLAQRNAERTFAPSAHTSASYALRPPAFNP